MTIKLIKNKSHLVIKRDGRLQPFSEEKLRKVIDWATNGNEHMTNELLKSINLKIYDKIQIQKLFDIVIDTAANLISPLYPQWDEVAKKLYILKIYKETWGLKKTGMYPHLKFVIEKGIQHGVYDKFVIATFTPEEIDELNSYIDPDRDFLFNYAGINIFYNKYCLNYSKTKKLELPQHAYMRVAMFAFYTEKDRKKRMQLIKDKYDYLSKHLHTEATPKMLNSLTPKPQLASCVLMTVEDDSWSILELLKWCGIFSKYAGGLAVDISRIRAESSYVAGNRGISSGPIPFVKMIESVISGFNQGGRRKGSGVISFPFWHYNALDLIKLKKPGGSEERRARKLQYAFKWYNKFTESILNNEHIALIDPKEDYRLAETYGEEFSDIYDNLSKKQGIRKKTVSAKEIAHELLEVRKETGNVYITFVDNINKQRMGEEPVFSSNLCQEVVIPSKPSRFRETKLEVYFDDYYLANKEDVTRIDFIDPGEIGLCNLASIDLDWWYDTDDETKDRFIQNLLISFDNAINIQFYPISEAKYANIRRRPIGIGAYNLAKLLARLKVKWTDDSAKEIVHKVFEDFSWFILKNSALLAKERGPYSTIENSKWKEGKVPLDVSILHNIIGSNRPDLNQKLYRDWDYVRQLIKDYGVRFSYHMSIAPTANSVKAINATESTEPIIRTFYNDKGVFSYPFIAPGLSKGYEYQIAWEIPPKTIIELAAIRQKFIDQSQSLNLYYIEPKKTSELLEDVIYAELLGIKTLYYMKTPKPGELEEICDSCAL